MRVTATFMAVAATLLCSTTDATSIPRRQTDVSAPKVIGLSTERRTLPDPVGHDRLRRRGSVQATLDNQETLYFVNMTIGTPPQKLRLHLDTGSSDLWVNSPSSRLCLTSSKPCDFAGTYNANSSSSYQYVSSHFNISYVDGSGASGDYVSDTVTLGQTSLKTLQFGIGYSSSSAQGILGIGYELNEVQVGRAGLSPYRNLPTKLVEDGLIKSSAYSLWLNDNQASTGSILFGGVDTAQYEGTLHTLPIQRNGGAFAEFLITLTSVTMGSTAMGESMALAVLLDSGSSLTYLPDDMVERIYTAIGAQFDSTEGAAYVPCSIANDKTRNLTFTFSSPASIVVPMEELVLELVTASGRRPSFRNGVPACLFGIAPAGTGTNVLGDTFLRSAYVVYDLDNNAISLAQTRFNATTSNVLEIGKGQGSVPGATAVSNPVAAASGLSRGNSRGVGGAASGAGSGPIPPSLLAFVTAVAGWSVFGAML